MLREYESANLIQTYNNSGKYILNIDTSGMFVSLEII